jgi:DNA repair protein RecN (Recombination protein N)
MLRFLGVRHLAVIEQIEIELESGLTVLTGETGAGKSILVEAVGLLVGGRASADLVRTGEDTATIQAIFEHADGREVIVRREISSQGRSRAFLDDTLATSAALKDTGAALVDLHGQHEHQALLDPVEHAGLLDTYATHEALVADAAAAHQRWRGALAALDRTRLDDREKRARIEMASFQLADIDKINPAAGEDESLGAERTLLANADRLGRLANEAFGALYDDEHAALTSLASVWKRVGELAALDARFVPYLEARDDIKSRLDDLAFFLRSYAADLDASPDRLQTVEDRLAALERLKRKYGPSLDDVRTKQASLKDEIAALDASDERAAALAADEASAREDFLAAARALSRSRHTAAKALGRALEAALGELAMPKSRVDVRVRTLEHEPDRWTARGIDDVEFFLSPNPGEEVRPLARIASGGELSRIMLALRTLAAADAPGRTLIFDEVDAGIGGVAADAVGARLQALAKRYQVLCITHLPQIAARATTHFQIAKQVKGGRTHTVLTKLDDSGREGELARMIAGAEVTPGVLTSAREMLALRQAKGESKSEAKPKGQRRGA